eukprot:Partr_v1_DN23645_c0_g1_i1_m19079 putative mitochondrial import inner membrane translocase subunit TIM54
MWKWRPSRGQLIFISTSASIAGLLGYDRDQCRKIRAHHVERASTVALQPMALEERPRHLTVFLSASSRDDGYKYKRAFEQYVKPVWDAAALDYEVLPGWEWYDDVSKRVTSSAKDAITTERALKETGGGDGLISLGRPSFKGVVVGVSQSLTALDIHPPVPEMADAGAESKKGWREWITGTRQSRQEEDKVEVDGEKMRPPIGYIPYQIPRWGWRVLSWFTDRRPTQAVGDAALAIALGNSVPMSDLFPGDLAMTVEEWEKPQGPREDGEESPQADSVEAGTVVAVPEASVQKMRMYY